MIEIKIALALMGIAAITGCVLRYKYVMRKIKELERENHSLSQALKHHEKILKETKTRKSTQKERVDEAIQKATADNFSELY